jgi:hypothetical protein
MQLSQRSLQRGAVSRTARVSKVSRPHLKCIAEDLIFSGQAGSARASGIWQRQSNRQRGRVIAIRARERGLSLLQPHGWRSLRQQMKSLQPRSGQGCTAPRRVGWRAPCAAALMQVQVQGHPLARPTQRPPPSLLSRPPAWCAPPPAPTAPCGSPGTPPPPTSTAGARAQPPLPIGGFSPQSKRSPARSSSSLPPANDRPRSRAHAPFLFTPPPITNNHTQPGRRLWL